MPERKTGYADWNNRFSNLFYGSICLNHNQPACTPKLKSLEELATLSYVKHIHETKNYDLVTKLFNTSTNHEPSYLKFLYSIATLAPLHQSSQTLALSNGLQFLEEQYNVHNNKIISYRYKPHCPYVGTKRYNNDTVIYSIFDTTKSLEEPCYVHDAFKKESYVGQSYQAFLNDTYFAVSNKKCIWVINLKNCNYPNFFFRENSGFYLGHKNPHLLFTACQNRLLIQNLKTNKENTLSFSAPIIYMNVFEQTDNHYIIEVKNDTYDNDAYKSYNYYHNENVLKEIPELRHGIIDCSPYDHVEEIHGSWYITNPNQNGSSINELEYFLTKIDPRSTEELALDPRTVTGNPFTPQSITYLGKDIASGYSFLSLGHLRGFLLSYTNHQNIKHIDWHGYRRAYNFSSGIAVRFALEEQEVLEFKFGSFQDKYIVNISKTEHPDTFVIQLGEYFYPYPNRISYYVLHFPLLKRYFEYKSMTPNQYRIQTKYEKRMQKLYYWGNYFKTCFNNFNIG